MIKKKYVFLMCSFFITGQLLAGKFMMSVVKAQTNHMKPIKEVKMKEQHSDSHVQNIYYRYRKKEFKQIENNIASLKLQLLVSNHNSKTTEVGKIAVALSGSVLIGSNKINQP